MHAGRKVRQRETDSVSNTLPDSLHPVIRRILLARNITDKKSLELELGRLEPPASLSGVQQAAELLAGAVVTGQRILIVGDFDADGATGTAVAVRALELMGAGNVGFRVPDRFEFGYGLSVALVETLASAPPCTGDRGFRYQLKCRGATRPRHGLQGDCDRSPSAGRGLARG